MCKHDVMNIQHAHCGLVAPRLWRAKSRPVSVSPLAHNGYSYTPFIAKSKAACGLCFHQLGDHVELPWLMCKYDVIHKNRKYVVYCNAARGGPAMAVGNMHKKFGKDRSCMCSDMLADRHTGHHNTSLPYRERSKDADKFMCPLVLILS